ncbi:hypothetical protein [Streptomyces asoensis]|uniref:hypothetical protein n=1 Tax=Streptomyces asoensis TaxID=249586 RepID=UPI0033E78227
MTIWRKTRVLPGMLPLAVVVLLTAGCGTQRAGDAGDAYRSARPTPSTPADFRCPGESSAPSAPSAPTAPAPQDRTGPPADHYAENHGFRVPIPLHGRNRCDGLAAVGRVKGALEPLRRRGDFAPDSVRGTLIGLGYSAERVRAYQNGSGVGFLIDIGVSPWCVEGTMSGDSTRAEAFGGYPDGADCEPPSGGH